MKQLFFLLTEKKFYKLKDIGEIQYSSGTGFFIGEDDEKPEYLVTNEHVVDEYVNDANQGGQYIFSTGEYYEQDGNQYPIYVGTPSCELRIYYGDNDYDIAVVDTPGDSEREDLALLRLKDGPTDKRKPLKLKILTGDVTTTPVYAIGFPGLLENSFTSSSKYEVGDITVEPGKITHEPKTDEAGIERIAVSSVIRHGNSGGPLVTEDGYVVGVNTNGYNVNGEESYYAITSRTLSRFLERANAKFEVAENTDDSSSAATEESSVEDLPESETTQEPQPEQSEGETTSGAGLAVGVVLIAAIVAIAALMLKKRKNTSPEGQSASDLSHTVASATVPAAEKKAMLRSLSTQHNGMTVAIHGNLQVMIGRDSSICKVVFREGTEGVSARHCSVSFDAASEEFILTDLRSTYGTYLNNGQKLTPNVPYRLKAGDGFYVGSQANSFRVELG